MDLFENLSLPPLSKQDIRVKSTAFENWFEPCENWLMQATIVVSN